MSLQAERAGCTAAKQHAMKHRIIENGHDERFRSLEPRFFSGLLGKAYAEATDFAKAEQSFLAVLQAESAFPGAHRELGKAYFGQNRKSGAEKELLQAIHEDPQDGDAYYYPADMLVQSARYQDGLPYLEKANSLDPDSWATYLFMEKAEFLLGHADTAVTLLRKATVMNPDESGAFYLLARALRCEGRAEDANAAMHRVMALHVTALEVERRALKDEGIVKDTGAESDR